MTQPRDDQFHRDKSFSEGDAAPRGTEPGGGRRAARTGQLEEDVAARGANPDPTGITANMPTEQHFSKPNTLNPADEQRQASAGRLMHGAGASSAPSAAGTPSESSRDVARAQGIDLKSGTAKDPPAASTRGEGAELSPGVGEAVQPRGNADADALLTDPSRAEGRS